MALTFELSEPTALAAGSSLVNVCINSGPKLVLTVHEVSAIWQDAADTNDPATLPVPANRLPAGIQEYSGRAERDEDYSGFAR